MMPRILELKTLWLILFAFWVVAFGIGSYNLFDNNEGLYASIAATMHKGGSWVIPALNGVPYIEKPPLFYWLDTIAFSLFGQSEWAARLPSVLASLAIGGMLAGLLKPRGAGQAKLAVLIWFSCIGIIYFSRMTLPEIVLTAFITAALLAFYRWDSTGKLRWLLASHAAVAAAVMTKGILGLAFVGAIALSYMLIERRPLKHILGALHPLALSLFLLLVLPWHLLAIQQESGFAWFYLVNENLLRLVGMREPHDYYSGPLWYYIPRVLLYLAPWSLLLPGLAKYCKSTWKKDSLHRLLMLWFGITFFVFSCASNKGNYYMLMGMPPLVLLLACWLGEAKADARWLRPFAAVATLLSLVIFTAGPLYLHFHDGKFSQRPLVDKLLQEPAPVRLMVFNDFEELSSLAFYWPQPLTIISSKSADLKYGAVRRPELFIEHDALYQQPERENIRVVVRKLPRLEEKFAPPGTQWQRIDSTDKASLWRWQP